MILTNTGINAMLHALPVQLDKPCIPFGGTSSRYTTFSVPDVNGVVVCELTFSRGTCPSSDFFGNEHRCWVKTIARSVRGRPIRAARFKSISWGFFFFLFFFLLLSVTSHHSTASRDLLLIIWTSFGGKLGSPLHLWFLALIYHLWLSVSVSERVNSF